MQDSMACEPQNHGYLLPQQLQCMLANPTSWMLQWDEQMSETWTDQEPERWPLVVVYRGLQEKSNLTAMGRSRHICRLTGITGLRKLEVSHVKEESGSSIMHSQESRQEDWREQFREQFSWPTATVHFPFLPTSEPIQAGTIPTSEMKVF